MNGLLQDVAYSLRVLIKRPLFAVVSIATLGLGIGANTAIFTVVNAVLLRPLPVAEPDRLVDIYTSEESGFPYATSSYQDFVDLRAQVGGFSDMAAHSLMFGNLSRDEGSELVIGELITDNYFDVLGLSPQLGRAFLPEENGSEGTHPVVILAEDFWSSRYNSDPAVLGQTLRLNGTEYQIVGVGPRGFAGTVAGFSPALWIPTMMASEVEPVGIQDTARSPGETIIERRGRRWLSIKGRLADAVSLEQAHAQLRTAWARLVADYPESNGGRSIEVLPTSEVRVHPAIDGALRPAGVFLLVVVGLVMLIACANVANMFLARATGRRREIALRLALGGGRGRIVRQLLTESVTVGLAGGVVGFLIALWATRALMSFQPPVAVAFILDLAPDLRVLGFTLLLSMATGIVFGLAPALRATRVDLVPDLKDAGAAARSRRLFDMRRGLVAAQVAICLVLLIGAALAGRSLSAARAVDLGFPTRGLAFLTLTVSAEDREGSTALYRDLLDRIRALPGVEAATLSQRLPFSMNIHRGEFYIGADEQPDQAPLQFETTNGDEQFFQTLGVPLLEGRGFEDADRADTRPVVVVSAELARRQWPGASAVGRHLTRRDGLTYEVIGVVADYKIQTVGEAPKEIVHFARSQQPNAYGSVLVRTRGDAAGLLPTLRREALAVDPNVLVLESTTMAEQLRMPLFAVTMSAALLTGFGAFALFLAAVGLYGVIAYSVSGRTREIGTRMALGADRTAVVGQVLGEGMRVVAVGLAAGLLVAGAASRFLGSVLYGVSPLDAVSFGAATAGLVVVAVVANLLPANRAARIDPLQALRHE